MKNKRKVTLAIFFILLAVLFLSACESIPGVSQESEESSSNEEGEAAEEGKTEEETEQETAEGNTAEELAATYRTDTQGSVSVGVAFLNPVEEDPDYFNFEVALNTHSVDLDEYDLSEMTTLHVEDQLQITEGIQWTDVQGGGHHVSGIIKVPKSWEEGNLNYKDVKEIQLIIENLDGIDSRIFLWEQGEF